MYRLKMQHEAFQVVDGPLEGRGYKHGESYGDIPPGEAHKFEEVFTPTAQAPNPEPEPGPKKGKKGGSGE